MKRLCFMLALLCLLLCACGKKTVGSKATEAPTTTEVRATTEAPASKPTTESVAPATEAPVTTLPPVTEPPMVENTAFAPYARDGALAVLVNEPFEAPLAETETWIEGEYERMYIIPRYVGSYVNLYGVIWSEDGSYTYTDKAVKSTLAADGCTIFSAMTRPEGAPMWYIEVVAPNGESASYFLTYDGRDGTPPLEYLTVAEY